MLRKPSLNKWATHTYCEEYTFPPHTPQKKEVEPLKSGKTLGHSP